MAALHEALTKLSPVDWSDVPQDKLEPYLEDILEASELIISSIPPPPNGTSFEDSKPQSTEPNTAKSHKDMQPSEARSLPPSEEYEALQSQWGKPVKISAKENPLEVSLYKMAGKDRHGAWFARRSVHEGIGFTKFRDAMKGEFEHSLKVEGGPGAGCIRGIGADKKLEELDVEDLGHVEVFQLSAQFPGPTTAREFIALVITSESMLSEKSVASSGITSAPVPRHFVIVSRPVQHPDAPERSGYVRGQYESVELIREIPINRVKSKSTPNLLDTAKDEDNDKPDIKRSKSDMPPTNAGAGIDDRELNPVEWIMVTRSDPGGGIPRFMVDRGTPGSMISDVHKFLDYAAKEEAEKEDYTTETAPSEETAEVSQVDASTGSQKSLGLFGQITQTLEAGLDAYAPTMVSSFVHNRLDHRHPDPSDDDSSSISDTDSFISATDKREHDRVIGEDRDSISITSLQAKVDSGEKKHLDEHEKKLLEIAKQREKLDAKLAKKREEEETRMKKAQDDEESEQTKARERFEKEMKKQEEKHKKEMDKLEARQEKETHKLEQKRKKAADRDVLQKVTRERDEFRSQVDLLKKENGILRQRIEHLESLTKTSDEA